MAISSGAMSLSAIRAPALARGASSRAPAARAPAPTARLGSTTYSLNSFHLASSSRAQVKAQASRGFLGKALPAQRAPIRRATSPSVKVEATAAAAPAKVELKPIKAVPALVSLAVGLAVRFLVPCPVGVTMQAWQLLSIFLATITGIVLAPLPTGATAFFGLTATVLTKTLSFQTAFSAFTNDVIWLIVIIFFIARGFVKTGLGDRCGYMFAKAFGKTTLGLAYALMATEAIICPGMPSTTARHGGVMLPIIASLSRACGSDPAEGTEKKMGAFLVINALYCGGISSALFMTGAAQNLLCNKLAGSIGAPMSTWGSWFTAACVPGIISLIAMPYIIYKVFPPEVKETPDAPIQAAKALDAMGPPSAAEKIVMGTMLALVVTWIGGAAVGISAPVAGMLGLCFLLATGVLSWADCLNEKGAWDTLTWFAVLVGLSGQLEKLGLISYIATAVSGGLSGMALPWYGSMAVLHVAYFLVHYLFASQTAQVGALYVAFLAMMIKAGAPASIAALTLSFSTNLFGAITHYASAQGAIYFGAGFVDLKTWWKLGLQLSAIAYGMWLLIGIPWWGFLGLLTP